MEEPIKLKGKILSFLGLLSISLLTLFFTNVIQMVTVSGQSMYPTYDNGDKLLINKTVDYEDLEDGAVIIIDTSDFLSCDYIIKRYVKELSTDAEMYVLGDNSDNSLDSRYFGTVSKDKLIGVVINSKENQYK